MTKKPFRLGVLVPNGTDATSFYRGLGPVFALQKVLGNDLIVEAGFDCTWASMAGIDALFMQRPCAEHQVRILGMAKANGVPVWVDYDDDLFSVPMPNPTFSSYSRPESKTAVINCLIQADIVTLSTDFLMDRYRSVCAAVLEKKAPEEMARFNPDKFIVCPNAYNDVLFGYSLREWQKPLEKANLLLLWRGSATHDADMNAFTKPLGEAFQRHGSDWTMNFVGNPYWLTIQHLEQTCEIAPERIRITPPLDIIDYMKFLYAVKPAAVHVPLAADVFNRSKSNIGWIEASHGGAMTLAPDWDEWRKPGIITYKNEDDYRNKLAMILKGEMPREHLVKQSRDYIRENLLLSRVNRIRETVLEMLARIDPWA